ncbi:DUF4192 family protein [Cellulomonas sp. 179-A 9B4 NHS]|uniref:DUF4192 family protein n=1 Tax=Cellulomonas sp. 179-A 9B4 NHS TaxID=3142379 RepID=UPI0039A28628
MSDSDPLERYVALLPYTVGYELSDEHVVVVALDAQLVPGPVMPATWPHGTDTRTAAEAIAAEVVPPARTYEASTLLVIGYGKDGPERAQAVADATLATADLGVPLLVHVDRDTVAVSRPGEAWTPARPLPDVAAVAVLQGLQAPAASRAELAARMTPDTEPAFAPLTEQAARGARDLEPSLRADAARRALDLLAAPGPSGPQHTTAMSTIAAMVADSRPVRDAVLLHAAGDAARVDALVRTYRAAPLELRSATAAAAGAALFFNGQHTALVNAVLQHVNPAAPEHRLAELVRASARTGADPRHLRTILLPTAEDGLAKADVQWHSDRASSMRSASFPHTPSAARAPSTGAFAPARKATGGRELDGPER